MTAVIEVQNLSKRYKEKRALDNVSLASSDVIDLFLYSSFPNKTDTANLMRCPVTTGATAREAQRALETSGLRVVAVATAAATRKRVGSGAGPAFRGEG